MLTSQLMVWFDFPTIVLNTENVHSKILGYTNLLNKLLAHAP